VLRVDRWWPTATAPGGSKRRTFQLEYTSDKCLNPRWIDLHAMCRHRENPKVWIIDGPRAPERLTDTINELLQRRRHARKLRLPA